MTIIKLPYKHRLKQWWIRRVLASVIIVMMLVGCGIIPPTEVSIQMKALVQEMNTKDINKGSSSHHNKTTALIHMGPHKTGTTTLQAYSKTFINQLKEDGYHLPFDWAPDDVSKRLTVVRDQRNAMSFASCFLNSPEAMRNQDPCAHEYVRAGANIAAEGKSMLVTSEGFSLLGDHALKSLATYATASFDEVIVVVFYRRHFEWFVSFFNECWKNRIFGGNNNNNTQRFITVKCYRQSGFNVPWHTSRKSRNEGVPTRTSIKEVFVSLLLSGGPEIIEERFRHGVKRIPKGVSDTMGISDPLFFFAQAVFFNSVLASLKKGCIAWR